MSTFAIVNADIHIQPYVCLDGLTHREAADTLNRWREKHGNDLMFMQVIETSDTGLTHTHDAVDFLDCALLAA